MASGGASPAPGLSGNSNGASLPVNGLSNLNPNNILSTTAVLTESSGSTPSTSAKAKICVFCGASPGKSPAHMAAARALGEALYKNNVSLVYGGGTVGLMGEVARTLVALAGPESVHGIIPEPLVKYERGPDSTVSGDGSLPEYAVYGKTTVVRDMHTRKQMMAQEVLAGGAGSGFVALSGGYGTLEELMEVVTWNQLGIHNRGVVVYNVEGYWDGLLEWVKGAVGAGFVGQGPSQIIKEAKEAEDVISLLRGYTTAEGRFKLTWGNE